MFATDKATTKIVAIKVVSKQKIDEARKVDNVFREKDLMMRLKGHPFMIELLGTCADDTNLYFISEYCTNGDLGRLIESRGKLSLEVTRAYAA